MKRRANKEDSTLKDINFSGKGAVYLSREAIVEIVKKYREEEVGKVVEKLRENDDK